MRTQIPRAGMRVLETGFLSAAIVCQGAQYGLGVIERSGMKERRLSFSAINVGAIDLLMLDVEELELINELPVAPQVSVSGGAEPRGLSVGEVGLHMDEGRDASPALVLPHLAHEGPVKIGTSLHDRVNSLIADELSENLSFCGAVEHGVEHARTHQGARHTVLPIRN